MAFTAYLASFHNNLRKPQPAKQQRQSPIGGKPQATAIQLHEIKTSAKTSVPSAMITHPGTKCLAGSALLQPQKWQHGHGMKHVDLQRRSTIATIQNPR
jgi:hypothetical protein